MSETPAPPLLPVDVQSLRIGPQVKRIPEKKAILKYGSTVKVAEAECLRFIAQRTSIPVPHVFEFYEQHGNGYILMTELDGDPLGAVWSTMSDDYKEKIILQLKGYVQQLQTIHGDFYGSLGESPSKDIFFQHLPFKPNDVAYGPYYSKSEYIAGLSEAVKNSKPHGLLQDSERHVVESIKFIIGEEPIFSHGDLHPFNILINGKGDITGIIDWEAAGYSFPERDYVEAKLRTQSTAYWDTILDRIFPDEFLNSLKLFQELERLLVLHTGF